MQWTPEAIEQMMTLMADLKSTSAVAKVMGISENAIVGKHYRERIRRGMIAAPRPSGGGSNAKRRKPPCSGQGRRVHPAHAPRVGCPPQAACSIVDVTGCRWPVTDDAAIVGGHAFCNAETPEGASYCAIHKRASVASGSNELIRSTIRAAVRVYTRKVA